MVGCVKSSQDMSDKYCLLSNTGLEHLYLVLSLDHNMSQSELFTDFFRNLALLKNETMMENRIGNLQSFLSRGGVVF